MDSHQFFKALWKDFVQLAPQAAVIREKLSNQGELVINDHVAFRTYNIAPLNIESLEPILFSLGYQRLESYQFTTKHLNAWSYIKPNPPGEPTNPLIFFSELKVEKLSPKSQQLIQRLVEAVASDSATLTTLTQLDEQHTPLFCRGRLWPMISYNEYQALLEESEYAAWMAIHGYHANHFTISLNHLQDHHSITSILNWVESEGFQVNEAGGRVKGSSELLLEQGSTMADQVPITFSCGHQTTVPGCFYEFALRYPDTNGDLFMGFVEGNADKIFESTHHSLTAN